MSIEGIEWVMVQDAIELPEFYRKAHFLLLNYTCRCTSPEPVVQLNEEAQYYRWVKPCEAVNMDLNQPTRTLLEQVIQSPLYHTQEILH